MAISPKVVIIRHHVFVSGVGTYLYYLQVGMYDYYLQVCIYTYVEIIHDIIAAFETCEAG